MDLRAADPCSDSRRVPDPCSAPDSPGRTSRVQTAIFTSLTRRHGARRHGGAGEHGQRRWVFPVSGVGWNSYRPGGRRSRSRNQAPATLPKPDGFLDAQDIPGSPSRLRSLASSGEKRATPHLDASAARGRPALTARLPRCSLRALRALCGEPVPRARRAFLKVNAAGARAGRVPAQSQVPPVTRTRKHSIMARPSPSSRSGSRKVPSATLRMDVPAPGPGR